MPIQTAEIQFNDEGTPVSTAFDDVYFSNDNGLQETEYVFIQNNHLPERWLNWQYPTFVVAETGFGTGLNFLVLIKRFNEFRQQNPEHPLKQLHFISFEKYPVAREDLQRALLSWPSLAEESEQLIKQYPLAIEGCHRMTFNAGSIHLDLWLGDVNELMPTLPHSLTDSVHAWFLDGFAPSKNPDMWQDSLFHFLGKYSAPDTTFATFTAAGIVKRGLRDNGFTVEKCKGYGRKREMLRGIYTGINENEALDSKKGIGFWHRYAAEVSQPVTHVAIVGAGLAGLNCALSLVHKGIKVDLYCADSELATGASGNTQGGFYPHLTVDFTRPSQLYSQCFLFAKQRYEWLLQQGYEFQQDNCGVLLLGFNNKQEERQGKLTEKGTWPQELVRQVNTQAAESIANVSLGRGGLFLPQAGWINPKQLVQALAKAAKATGKLSIHYNKRLLSMTQQVPEQPQLSHIKWRLQWHDNSETSAPVVILATGHESAHLTHLRDIPMQAVRGQVETIKATEQSNKLSTVLCHKGYMTPALDGSHALGATFIKNDTNTEFRIEDETFNLSMLKKSLPGADWVDGLETQQQGRAGIRCSTFDHLPLMGSVPDITKQSQQYQDAYKALPTHKYPLPEDHRNVYVLTGLGSRGLCTAPLLAEALVCQITGNPLPLSQDQLNALNPNRFLIKQLVRREKDLE